MESLIFDPTAHVVRSTGDTPGVVAFLAGHRPNGAPILEGCGLLAIDPGGTHPHKLIDGSEAIRAVANPITHVALATLVTITFAHAAFDLAAAQAFEAISNTARRHDDFTEVNATHLRRSYPQAQREAAIKEFGALSAEREARYADTERCECMRCAVIEDNQPTVEGQLTAEGTPRPDDIVRAAEELAALDALVDAQQETVETIRRQNAGGLFGRLRGGRWGW